MSDTQNEKTQKAAELVSDAYGVTVSTMYELLQKGAAGDAVAVKALSRMGMVVGSTIDVVKFIDAASRDDVRTQITSSCSIVGGIAGGAAGAYVSGGALSVVLGTIGSKAGEKLCGELYDSYIEYKKNNPDKPNRNTDEIKNDPLFKDAFRKGHYSSNDINPESFKQASLSVGEKETQTLTARTVAQTPEQLKIEERKSLIADKVVVAVTDLCDRYNYSNPTARENTCWGSANAAVHSNFTGNGTIIAGVDGTQIALREDNGNFDFRMVKIDSREVANIPAEQSKSEIAAYQPVVASVDNNLNQVKTQSGPKIG